MKKIRVGIIGYGLSGRVFHAPLIQANPEMELLKIVSGREEEIRSNLPDVEPVRDVNCVFGDPDIDLVVIASPNDTHYALGKQALEAGKHVVVEKPFVVRSTEGKELIRIAQERGRILSVYHNRRWDSDFLTVADCIRRGRLGEIHTYEVHFDRYRPRVRNRWKEQDVEGAGVLYDLGSHYIDQALQLFGLPDTVWADLLNQRPGARAVDYFHVVLGYGRFLRVIIHSGSMVKQPGPRFEVHGTRGSLLKYGLDVQEEALKNGKMPGGPDWGKEPEEQYAELSLDENGETRVERIPSLPGAYPAFYEGVADAILREGPVPVSAEEANRTIRVIEAALRSHRENRTVGLSEETTESTAAGHREHA